MKFSGRGHQSAYLHPEFAKIGSKYPDRLFQFHQTRAVRMVFLRQKLSDCQLPLWSRSIDKYRLCFDTLTYRSESYSLHYRNRLGLAPWLSLFYPHQSDQEKEKSRSVLADWKPVIWLGASH